MNYGPFLEMQGANARAVRSKECAAVINERVCTAVQWIRTLCTVNRTFVNMTLRSPITGGGFHSTGNKLNAFILLLWEFISNYFIRDDSNNHFRNLFFSGYTKFITYG